MPSFTRQKRRAQAAFYKRVSQIETRLIDNRNGLRHYLISLPLDKSKALHIEACCREQMASKYREMIAYCRKDVAAEYFARNGSIITHVAIQFNGKTYSLPNPKRHHHVIRLIAQENGVGINGPDRQGFTDACGRFFDREEAYLLAIKNGQLQQTASRSGIKHHFSGDLW